MIGAEGARISAPVAGEKNQFRTKIQALSNVGKHNLDPQNCEIFRLRRAMNRFARHSNVQLPYSFSKYQLLVYNLCTVVHYENVRI